MEHEAETRIAASFADLIAPTSTEVFFADYWETTFLHVHNAPGRFARYFSLRDIDTWVSSTRSGVVFVLLPKDEGIRFDIHQAQDLTPGDVLGNFRRGCAQILKRLADWPSLQGLVHHLGRVFHADVQVNAFLTPAGARTLPTYTANDDIFVLQLKGEAVWRLHELTVLQLDLSQKRNLEFPAEWQRRTEASVLAEVRLRPGDLLFIPRGMPHFVTPPDRTSLHLSLYITPLFWTDFLKLASEYAAVHFQELRRALPPGFVDSDEICDRMRSTFQQVMGVFQEVSFDGVLAAAKRNRVALQGFPCDSQFDAPAGTEGLTVDSEVERRQDVLCTVEEVFDAERNRKITLFFGDGRLSGPPRLLRALEFIRDRSRFRVSEIPGLDANGKLVLARRLIAEGLLTPSQAAEELIADSVAALP
ncbi:MAG TPA: cupin domain-containing protein [Thermoanaerobaculia bacterium]|jgi:hypothetical protein|nr:cupin domain-containing protein [Thermoanaerobaculia bacterium]